jgi:cell wall-associated NlpC family hydrolase
VTSSEPLTTALLMGAVAAAVVGLVACAPAPLRPPGQGLGPAGDAPAPSQAGEADRRRRLSEAVRVAKSRLGAPYRYGEEGPIAFDCSGLVHYAFQRVGIQVPRTVRQLRRRAYPVKGSRLQPGDLLFFRLGGKVGHVAIYVGDDRFIHAPKTGERVSYAKLDDPFWERHLVGAGRFF